MTNTVKVKRISRGKLLGVWSATPTPFTDALKIDRVAVKRLLKHHLRLGINKLFLGGTCGEGPWMPDADRRQFVRTVSEYAEGRFILAAQVTDNSPARILDNIHQAKEDGANIAVIATPYCVMGPLKSRCLDLYMRAIEGSPLPIGIYERGQNGSVVVPISVMKEVCCEKKVVLVKDSSCEPARQKAFLAARKKNKQLCLFTGDEFDPISCLKVGYDGMLLGGGIFNGLLARQLLAAAQKGDWETAEMIQERIQRINFTAYGGKKIQSWLTGLKTLLVEMGIFRTAAGHVTYDLSSTGHKAIKRLLETDADALLP